ncbi:TraK family protein [Legionella fairfieldensis]|uniref:TraK family protein n=1 Tax=Legionella fairfieldensis TaxID=45064 RepID=UPI00048D948C|nr:TraK family protein [Legionella fairfieldensis]
MAKTLSARIAERVAKKKVSRNAKNRAAFLALRPDIIQALADGWPVKSIWETLHEEEKITFSYQAFRGYVNRLILTANASTELTNEQSELLSKPIPLEKTPKFATQGVSGFTFQATPNKEDLL